MRNLIFGTMLAGLLPHATLAQDVSPERITVKVVSGITSSHQLPSQTLVNARQALAAGHDISISNIRQLADLGDGFAALRFAQTLAQSDNQSLRADTAHYYGIAAATGRGGAITGLIRTLDSIDPETLSEGRRKTLKNILITYALAGNSHALDAVMRYQLAEDPLGQLSSDLIVLMESASGEGAAQLGLQMAVTIMRDPAPTTTELLRARRYLTVASTATSLETKVVALNLTPLLEADLQSRPDFEDALNTQQSAVLASQPLTSIAPKIRPTNLLEVTP
ncbi:MAG: hypothetical protein ABJN34_03645 [Litoreibacter sp.]|uniref:hypothetical protein n=1 Tax=Litoreibacter sp. TaxID=1969459 RepID=UPI00329A62BD